jgi:hypothetical protein
VTTDDPLVMVRHCTADGARYCAPGLRTFCRRHGIDFRAFLREGIPASVVEQTGDAMAMRAAANARAERAIHGQQ